MGGKNRLGGGELSLPTSPGQMSEALAGKANASSLEGLVERLDRQSRSQRSVDDIAAAVGQLREELRSKAAKAEVSRSPPGFVCCLLAGSLSWRRPPALPHPTSLSPKPTSHPCLPFPSRVSSAESSYIHLPSPPKPCFTNPMQTLFPTSS